MFDPVKHIRSTRHARVVAVTSGVVLGALSLFVPGAGAADAVYGGPLTRGSDSVDPIVLTADARGNVLKSAVIGWTAPCASGNTYEFARTLKVYPASNKVIHIGEFAATRNAHGVFRASSFYSKPTSTGSADESMTITGKLKHGSGSGTLKADVMFTDTPAGLLSEPPTRISVLDTCKPATMRWKVFHRAGIIYGGTTSLGDPVVMKLSPDRRMVDEFDAGWAGDCQPGGRFDFPGLPFAAYPLDAQGQFGNRASQTFGGDTIFDFDVHGRVGRSKASGGFSDIVTFSDATVCTSGALTWTAKTG